MKTRKLFPMAAWLAAITCLVAGGCRSTSSLWDYHEAKARGIVITVTTHYGEAKATGEWGWQSYREGRQYAEEPVFILFEKQDEFRKRPYSSATASVYLTWPSGPDKSDSPIHFSLVRPAGRWDFHGAEQSRGADGTYVFQPDPSFVDEVGRICGQAPSINQLVDLSIAGAPIEGLNKYKTSVRALDIEGWLKLVNYGVTPEFAADMTASVGEVSVDELIKFRNHGLTPEFAASMKGALGDVSIDALIECRNHGLTPEYVSDFSSAGYSFDHRELIRLRNHGIQADFAAALSQEGMDLTADQLIKLRNSGMEPSYVLRLKKLGFSPNLDDIIELRNRGIREEYVAGVEEAGYQLSKDEIIRLANSGVPAGFIRSVKKLGYTFSADQIVRLRNSGVSESYLAEILEPGRKPLSADLIIDLRMRGVPAETVRAIRAE